MENATQDAPAVRNIISVAIKDKTALHANYMPFIRGGALYAASDKRYKLGDDVVLSLKLLTEGKKLAVPGRVVWMSPSQGQGIEGVGIQFIGRTKDVVRSTIESILGDLAKKPSVYHTY